MPTELQIIRAREFVRLGPEGEYDLTASKAALALLARACLKRRIACALLDLRALKPGPTPKFEPTDLDELISTFKQIGFDHTQRLAVLYRADPYHRARMFAFIGKHRGWNVRSFDDFERALLWLSEESPAPSRNSHKPVPVHHRPSHKDNGSYSWALPHKTR